MDGEINPIEEIERKAVEELERILLHTNQRRSTIEQARSSLVTLWNTTSGVISKASMNLIASAMRSVEQQYRSRPRPQQTAVFVTEVKGKSRYVVLERRDSTFLHSIATDGETIRGEAKQAPPTEVLPEKWAADAFQAAVERLSPTLQRII